MRRRPLLLLPLLAAAGSAAALPTSAHPSRTLAFAGSSSTDGTGASSWRHAYPQIAADRIAARLGWNVMPAVVGRPGAEGDRIAEAAISILDLRPWAMVIQMGANAALRGEPPESLDGPLSRALGACQERRIPVLVLGPQTAPAIPEARRVAVERALEASTRRHGALWLPRDEGVSVGPDGLHHDDAGHAEIGRRVADALVPLLRPA